MNILVINLKPTIENYNNFIDLVKLASRKQIPRGCCKHYIPGLTLKLVDSLHRYSELYETNPFEENTIKTGGVLSCCKFSIP